jgi:hypothetical protein
MKFAMISLLLLTLALAIQTRILPGQSLPLGFAIDVVVSGNSAGPVWHRIGRSNLSVTK